MSPELTKVELQGESAIRFAFDPLSKIMMDAPEFPDIHVDTDAITETFMQMRGIDDVSQVPEIVLLFEAKEACSGQYGSASHLHYGETGDIAAGAIRLTLFQIDLHPDMEKAYHTEEGSLNEVLIHELQHIADLYDEDLCVEHDSYVERSKEASKQPEFVPVLGQLATAAVSDDLKSIIKRYGSYESYWRSPLELRAREAEEKYSGHTFITLTPKTADIQV